MAVSRSKKIVLLVVIVVGYLIGNHKNSGTDKASGNTEAPEKAAAQQSSNTPTLSEDVLLKNEVIFTCKDIARSSLSLPDTFETEQTESGIDEKNGKQVYYFTLHFSGMNAFNSRITHTIECYGTVGDKNRTVTYKTFN